MVEIPEHLLKRSREAMAKAKAAKGEAVEEEPAAEEAAPGEQAAPAPPEEAPVEETAAAPPVGEQLKPPAEEAAVEVSGPGAEPAAEAGYEPVAAALPRSAYPPEDLVESAAGIKEVASSRAPGWLIAAFVIIPVISLLYMTQFSHGVPCGKAGTLQVGAEGRLESCDGKPLPSPGTGGGAPKGPDGKEIFAQKCAACHGPNGEGGVGRPLNKNNATTLLQDFPDAAAQVEFVTKGNQAFPQGWGANSNPPKGVMPAFGNSLSPEEIRAVVQFERSLAGETTTSGS
jgi:mono/diheme cytochrome c family protein